MNKQEQELPTLTEHNEKFWEGFRQQQEWEKHPTVGLACPECGVELVYDNPNIILACCPSKQVVVCLKCGYSGYKY